MKNCFIYSHNPYSKGANALRKELNIKRIKHENSVFKDRPFKTIINWGSSSLPYTHSRIINPPTLLGQVTNKLNFFNLISARYENDECPIPSFTTDQSVAVNWQSEGYVVVERHKLTGHSGEGIRIVSTDEEVKRCPLYTRYIKKKEEYRVHICNREVMDVQRKVLPERNKTDNINWFVRSHDNGFIYQRNNLRTPAMVTDLAKSIHDIVGLDFGAYDIIYNAKQDKAYVLEVNTAPGLENTTVTNYANELRRLLTCA